MEGHALSCPINNGRRQSDALHELSARGLFRRLPFELRRVAPETFQAVKVALFVVKHVHHDLEIIEDDPLTHRETVHCGG